jgi:chitinase
VRRRRGGTPPGEVAAVGFDDDDEERPQLSAVRVIIAVAIVVALLGGAAVEVRRAVASTPNHPLTTTWFAPYVDTTLTPTYQFQDPPDNPARQVVLGFVVAQSASSCEPSWGTYYTTAQAANTLDLDSRVAQVRANGGTPIVSFGGQANTELALACTSTASLEAAYDQVITHYDVTTVDFDIEGASLDNPASIARRTAAVVALQHKIRAAGGQLAVWLTLPVEPDGLQDNALSVVTSMVRGGVDLAGVNAMTMDFNGPESNMYDAVTSALGAVHTQLGDVYRSYGVDLTSAQVWNRVGATVQIGTNDTAGEVFTLADASQLVTYAQDRHLGRVSEWSLNRDRQCGTEFAEVGVNSNTCSGTEQTTLAFSNAFATLKGTAAAVTGSRTPAVVVPNPVDNPATSPYPIWQPGASYITGYKVVREGYVYQAKWYNQADDPAAETQFSYQTPWLLIGPVLPGSHAPTIPTLTPGTYPAWNAKTIYHTGAKVLRDGLPYQAKYYSQGDDPLAAAAGSSDSPWTPDYTIPGEPKTTN